MVIPETPAILRKFLLCNRYFTRYPLLPGSGSFGRSIQRTLHMFNADDLILAHAHSSDHRNKLLSDSSCGCFTCLQVFTPETITRWIPDTRDETAICPHCANDTVLGNSCGHEITTDFLRAMRRFWRPALED